jgi:SAM-dependent methyltransferase
MDLYQNYFEANKQSWNKRTAVHKDSAFYDLASFKKGRSSLNKIELEELGNVKGKTLLHLQCHFGMDTISWQREGANCVGVDLSDEAIKLAREINAELKLGAKFICTNIYDLMDNAEAMRYYSSPVGGGWEGADIVFTSYGTIGWLPDLDKWAGIVAHFLKPGGIFYIADFHPVLWMMDEHFEKIKYHYFNTEVITEEISGTYSDRDAPIKSIEHGWNHPFSEIFNALVKHGLQVQQFNEFPYSPYNCFSNLEQGTDGMWRIKGMDERMPMMYSIKAVKQV